MWTFVVVEDATYLQHEVLVFRGHEECFDYISSSEMYLYAPVFACLFKLSLIPVCRGPPQRYSCCYCYC